MPREIQHLYQKANKTDHTCGQVCVAMAAGIGSDAAVALIGTRGRTRGLWLKKALNSLGIRTGKTVHCRGDFLDRWKQLPAFCIARLNFVTSNHEQWRRKNDPTGKFRTWPDTKKSGHWILIWNGKRYDPLRPRFRWPPPVGPVSYFEILDTE